MQDLKQQLASKPAVSLPVRFPASTTVNTVRLRALGCAAYQLTRRTRLAAGGWGSAMPLRRFCGPIGPGGGRAEAGWAEADCTGHDLCVSRQAATPQSLAAGKH